MTGFDRLNPREAVNEMMLAGARFTVRRREDSLGLSFVYNLELNADRERCRCILAAVKARPAPYFEAFKIEVEKVAKIGGAS